MPFILFRFLKLGHICMRNFGNGNFSLDMIDMRTDHKVNFSLDMIDMRTDHKVIGHSNSGIRLGSNLLTYLHDH